MTPLSGIPGNWTTCPRSGKRSHRLLIPLIPNSVRIIRHVCLPMSARSCQVARARGLIPMYVSSIPEDFKQSVSHVRSSKPPEHSVRTAFPCSERPPSSPSQQNAFHLKGGEPGFEGVKERREGRRERLRKVRREGEGRRGGREAGGMEGEGILQPR